MKFFSIMGKIMEVRIEQRAKDTIDELKKKDIDMVEKIKLLFKKIQNEWLKADIDKKCIWESDNKKIYRFILTRFRNLKLSHFI